ncbi:MAG: 4-hydroxy-tetrahydrodipicolinate reductase [Lachnospiraceae bacterium]|nr:4-hydroxy-tetrahydrodipicolinate reductase [Lachnospiraceae bacterium]
MLKVIIVGSNGKMGKVLDEVISAEETVEIVAGVDKEDLGYYSYPVFQSVAACTVKADAVIDFSVSVITDGVVDDCVAKKLPLVLCTTGLSEAQMAHIDAAAKEIPIVQSYNMSLGINTLVKLLKSAAPLLADAGFDIEIIEKHHNQKIDAPSGTALLLANSMNEVLDHQYYYQYDRSTRRQKRERTEIGISAIRGGTIVGEHEVIFAGKDEVISLKHEAHSKAVFAKGAVQAVKFLADKENGRYTMADVIA